MPSKLVVSDLSIERRLRDLGHELPELAPVHKFLPAVQVGNMVYISGHAPFRDGEFRYRGKVGRELDLEAGRRAAELAVLGCLTSLKAEIGKLESVRRIVKVNGYVNCDPEFTALPKVTDAASSLLVSLFGDAGRHARTTVGTASLPFGVAVEVEMLVQIEM
jgi:enamine deaminase RidA (YjgF/YER057c/UK114 family)